MRMQLAVQRRRIHQHNRAQQVGRNVAAEVDNRRAARRQRLRAVGLVSPRRYRVIGRIGEPVLVNRQVGRRPTRLGTESVPRSTVTVAVDVSPSWSVIVYWNVSSPSWPAVAV